MIKNGCCGWYYRVLDSGVLAAGDAVTLAARPNPDWTIARFHRLIVRHSARHTEFVELSNLEGLAAHWTRVASGAVVTPAS